MRLSACSVMLLLLLVACDSQQGELPDLKPESSRLDASTDFADLVDLGQSLRSPSGRYVSLREIGQRPSFFASLTQRAPILIHF